MSSAILRMQRALAPNTRALLVRRTFASTPAASQRSEEDIMDRTRINTESNEYSKSGGDGESAHQADPAFETNLNDPKNEQRKAQEGPGDNPLDASPANHELSQPHKDQSPTESSPKEGARERSSGGGSPSKHGKLN